jgi:putative ABC transport system permease protein
VRNVTIKGLLAHKLRLALTALAIVLGVTFISGTFILTDTLQNTFTTLFGNIYAKVDFQVRGVAQLGSGANATRNELPESLLATVRGVPGVAAAEPEVTGYAQFVAPDGKAIATGGGAPTLGVAFDPDQQISPLHLIAGGPPVTSDDVVMDAGTAQKYGFTVGDRVRILSAGPTRTFTITGITEFGTANNLAGATLAAFTLPTAQAIALQTGKVDDINVVTAPGASKAAVQQAIATALPPGVEVVTGQTVVNESTDSVNQALSFFSTALLVFAFISLFVGAFTIYNTFSIIVGQRTRELALLRIVGASRRQVFGSVLAEAAITGFVSSVIGLGLGVLAALGLQALLRGFGVTLPPGSLVFEPRTVLVGLVVGVGVTVLSAIGPARGAVRIPPVAALDDRQSAASASLRHRFIWGTVLALAGAVLLGAGLARPAIQLVGLGAAALFIGVATLSPALARPLSSVIGRPLPRLLGVAGKLGRENSMRSPRRTAQTAAALMVGLALVSAMAVFGASLSKSATSSADQALSADLIVTPTGSGELSDSVPATASAVPGVTATTAFYQGRFDFGSSLTSLTAVSTEHLADTVILRMTAGTPAALAAGQLLIDSTTATSKHLAVGDTVHARFTRTGPATLRVGGVYQANALIGSYLVSAAFFLAHFPAQPPGGLLLRTGGSTAVDNAVTRALAPYPNVQVQTRAQFEQAQVSSVNQLLGLVYALLGLAVIIALIGIVNTLMLSVFERTREIGLLRAVGMRRRQVRVMVRSEAVILAIFGAIIGIVIGTALGLALVSSLRQQGITDTAVPVTSLLIFLLLSAVLGLVAASWPARRAAKLDVLAAIAAELPHGGSSPRRRPKSLPPPYGTRGRSATRPQVNGLEEGGLLAGGELVQHRGGRVSGPAGPGWP